MAVRTLTVAAIDAAYAHTAHDDCPGWLGYGYLAERRSALTPSTDAAYEAGRLAMAAPRVPAVDLAIIDRARALGWDEERLFDWLNSRDGRHFADTAIWDGDIRRAVDWYLPERLGRPFRR